MQRDQVAKTLASLGELMTVDGAKARFLTASAKLRLETALDLEYMRATLREQVANAQQYVISATSAVDIPIIDVERWKAVVVGQAGQALESIEGINDAFFERMEQERQIALTMATTQPSTMPRLNFDAMHEALRGLMDQAQQKFFVETTSAKSFAVDIQHDTYNALRTELDQAQRYVLEAASRVSLPEIDTEDMKGAIQNLAARSQHGFLAWSSLAKTTVVENTEGMNDAARALVDRATQGALSIVSTMALPRVDVDAMSRAIRGQGEQVQQRILAAISYATMSNEEIVEAVTEAVHSLTELAQRGAIAAAAGVDVGGMSETIGGLIVQAKKTILTSTSLIDIPGWMAAVQTQADQLHQSLTASAMNVNLPPNFLHVDVDRMKDTLRLQVDSARRMFFDGIASVDLPEPIDVPALSDLPSVREATNGGAVDHLTEIVDNRSA